MRKFLVVFMMVLMLTTVTGRVTFAERMPIAPPTIGLDPIAKPEPISVTKPNPDGIPSAISEMEEISIHDIDTPYDVTGPYNYRWVYRNDVGVVTEIGLYSFPVLIVGQFYYDINQGVFAPYGDEKEITSIYLRPVEDHCILYASVSQGEFDGVVIEDPWDGVNSGCMMYTDWFCYGSASEIEGYPLPVIVPDSHSGEHVDAHGVLTSPFGGVPCQDGNPFYLGDEKCEVKYYRYGDNVFTYIEMNNGSSIFIKGGFVYDITYDRMYCKSNPIYIQYDGCEFQIHAGEVSGVYGNYYNMGNNIYHLYSNWLYIINNENSQNISLHEIEGLPLVMY